MDRLNEQAFEYGFQKLIFFLILFFGNLAEFQEQFSRIIRKLILLEKTHAHRQQKLRYFYEVTIIN